jgi:methyl-accepting chemotaxis protein
MIDSLLISLGEVSRQLLPILGAVALGFLCVALNRLAKLLDGITKTLTNLDPAVKSVNSSLEKVQAPLDTVVRYSHTLDDMHEKTVDSVKQMAESASEGVEKVKNYVIDKLKEADTYDDVRPYEEESN